MMNNRKLWEFLSIGWILHGCKENAKYRYIKTSLGRK